MHYDITSFCGLLGVRNRGDGALHDVRLRRFDGQTLLLDGGVDYLECQKPYDFGDLRHLGLDHAPYHARLAYPSEAAQVHHRRRGCYSLPLVSEGG